uniref:Signal recognition particle subunit SRP72 n=1 Tax=Xenopsylla cheopis TaxID=163159 RepID=A0A6M2DSB5_XENCH
MSTPKETNIRSSYIELNKYGLSGEYEKALKAANKILQLAPDESKAFQCKIVSLIQLSKFNDAHKALTSNNKLSTELIFYKAYCEYRLNKPQDALTTVDSAASLTPELKELRAQILYRLENYNDCLSVYRDIVKNTSDDYEDERATNMSAVIANMYTENPNKAPLTQQQSEHTYELCYNVACMLVGQKKYKEAEAKLVACQEQCKKMLEEDGASEEDILEELAILKVQQAYCQQQQDRIAEATVLYNEALKHKASDASLVAVAGNNLTTINGDQNVFDSKKKMKAATSDAAQQKLNYKQRKSIALNNALLSLYTNQSELCKQLCSHLNKTYPTEVLNSELIKATLLAKENNIVQATNVLQAHAKKYPDDALAARLACVQLLLSQSERAEAIKQLKNLDETRFKPGIVSALVTLLQGEGRINEASVILKEAVEWYKKNKENAGDLESMWRQAADFHLRGGEPETAASSLEQLLKINPNDVKTLARLVVAYVQFNPSKALTASQRLPVLGLSENDLETLENTNWAMGSKNKKPASKVEASPGTPGTELLQKSKTKKNRKRKGKLPKNYDASQTPDPERWLPKHERTGFRKKRDRRTRDIIKGSQGMATGAADQYDMTKAQNLQNKNSPVPQTTPDTQGPRQQQRKVTQKKKKKGNKW